MPEQNNSARPRLPEISVLNSILCLLVIFIHSSAYPVTALNRSSWQYLVVMAPWRLSAFAVQGFLFLGGLKLTLSGARDFNYFRFLKSRAVRVILPYIAWVCVYYAYFCFLSYFSFNLGDLVGYVLRGDLVGHFYFIIIIVQFYLTAPLWIAAAKKCDNTVLLLVCLMLTVILGQHLPDIITIIKPGFEFAYNDRTLTTYIVYWAAGCCAGLNYEAFKASVSRNRIFIAVMFAVTAACDVYLTWLNSTDRRFVYWLEDLHILYCVCAILFFYSLSMRPETSGKKLTLRAVITNAALTLDTVSYGIYLFHPLVIFIVNGFVADPAGLSVAPAYALRLVAAYAVPVSAMLIWRRVAGAVRAAVKSRYYRR